MEKNIIGERLRQERMRLGFTQEACAAIGGIKKLAQISYEQGKTFPDASYLAALANVGLDVLFVTIGAQSSIPLTKDEHELLGAYRILDVRNKARLHGILDALTLPEETNIAVPKSKIKNHTVKGDIGQQVAGDINTPQKIKVGSRSKKK